MNNIDLANAFPSPLREAIKDMLDVLPFYVEAHVHVLYPERTYGTSCRKLDEELRASARLLHTGMSSIFPSTLKDPSDPSKGYHGAFTPPSNWAAIAHAPDVFAAHCHDAGSAAVTAAVFELGHIPMRKIYWAVTTRGTQFDGRSSVYVELLQNVALQKLAVWSNFGNQRHYPNVRRTRLRHHKRQEHYRAKRALAARARKRWYECAWASGGGGRCSYASIAADGRDNPNGFHCDAVNNSMLRVKQTGQEHDDANIGAERDDDLPIETVVEEDEIVDTPAAEDDYDEMTDDEEMIQLERAGARVRAAADGPTVADYQAALQRQDEDSEPPAAEDPEGEEVRAGSMVAPGGTALIRGAVPLE